MNPARRVVAFVRLARAPFLLGGFAGFALGAAVARFDGYPLDVARYVVAQALVTAFHLMVHFANEYYDQETDALTTRTHWSGGSGVLPGGDLPPAVALRAALACAAVGIALVAYVVLAGQFVVALLAVAVGLLGWIYSAPPARVLARGLGELDTILTVAVLVPLLGYAAFTGRIGVHALIATIPCACAMFAMMLAVEVPDAPADAATGKRTLVVRWGIARAVRIGRASTAAAVMALFAVAGATFDSALAPLVALAVALVALAGRAPRVSGPLAGVAFYAATTCALALAVLERRL